MKIKRCALGAASVLVVGTVAFLRWSGTSDGTEKSVTVAASSALMPSASSAVAAVDPATGRSSSNQTATVRGTKPYVLTGERNFNKSLRLAVEALGAKPVGVLARNSLLIEADAAAVARLKADRRFAVAREFLPSDKIAPALAAAISSGADVVDVSLVTLSADDHRRVQDRVVACGGEILSGCFNEGTTFRARMPASLVSKLASFGDVRWMEQFVRPHFVNDRAIEPVAMNVSNAWFSLSLSGTNQIISTSDSGIDLTHLDLTNQVPVHKVVEGCVDYDAVGHGTHTAGSIVGDGTLSDGQIRGMAWGAKLHAWFCAKDDGKRVYTPTTMAELFRGSADGTEWADAYIHSASWGSDTGGEYTSECADIDKYVWEHPDFLPVFSAGNAGANARTIGSPAAAKNVLAVGATQNVRTRYPKNDHPTGDPTRTASFSSRGPCQDGRTKPDVAAPGVGILSTRAYNHEYDRGMPETNTNYAFECGTSMSCPLTAGAVALVREWLISNSVAWKVEGEAEIPTAALMKAIVTGGAKDAASPNNDQGWGRVDVMESLAPSKRAVKLVDRIPFAEGKEFTWVVETTKDAPLDVQLAWIDYPGDPSAGQTVPKIVNDLDLTVQTAAGAEILHGNGGTSADSVNTLESVRLGQAAATKYYVTVSCPNVLHDYEEGGAAALYIRGAFDPEAVESYATVRIVKSPAVTNMYFHLDKALAEAEDGDVIEILADAELREGVVLADDLNLTIVATNADPYASRIVRRDGADILVANGSLLFSNIVFKAESTTPVRASVNGTVKVAGLAVFDDIVSRTPGILTDRPAGFELAGQLLNGITVECSGASTNGSPFGVYSCPFAVAAESAPRIASTSGERRAGVADGAGILKWSDEVTVKPEVAVAYVDGDEPVYYRALDDLFDNTNGNVVIMRSGLVLRKPRTLSGRQTISAADGVGAIVIRPEGAAGFTVGAGCDLTVAGIIFEGYTGNGLFVLNGTGAKLTVTNSAFRDIEGTNKWSGAIAVLKGSVTSVDTDFENCRATGAYKVKMPSGIDVPRTVKSYGGAIYLDGKDCALDLNGGTITGCFAQSGGGGIYAKGESSICVRGGLIVKGNSVSEKVKDVNDIELESPTATLTLSGKLTGEDGETTDVNVIGIRYGTASDEFGNDENLNFAKVEGVSSATAVSSAKAFFNDAATEDLVATTNGNPVTRLKWIRRTLDERWLDEGDPDAAIRVSKSGAAPRYCKEPEYAFAWIDADATVEVLRDVRFGADLVVTNGVKVTLMSTNVAPYTLTRRGKTEIRVLPGASLTVTNLVLDGNGSGSAIGLVKVEGAALELEAGTTVRNVCGSADRASGAISVQKGGTFTMRSGAEIVNCRNDYVNAGSKSGYGGGLLVEDHSTANLLGGSITGCAANRGGGVFIGTESEVRIAGDLRLADNSGARGTDNLCVADQSSLVLTSDFTGAVGYNEGRSGDTNVFGKVAAGFSGNRQAAAHRFTHDFTGDFGMAVSDGSETLLVWGSALDADGKYDGGTYALVNGGEPFQRIAEPAAESFTYDGTAKTCLTDGIGYRVLAGNVATNVGNYTVVVTTRAGFAWSDDGPSGQREIPWTIEAAEYELKGVTFEDATFVYDGTMKYLALTGTLPAGFSVEYENNGRWQPGTNEVKAVISGSVPNYKPNPFKTTWQANLIIVDPEGNYHGETEPPSPLPTVTTNWPSAIAFSSITRVADTSWILSVTNRVKWCRYRLICTDDLAKGFTTTGDWEQATAEGLWTTNVIFSADEAKPAYFWRAEGTWGIVPEGE